MWQQWVNLILGIWVVISPFFLGADTMATNLIVTGSAIAILAAWGAVQHDRHYAHSHRPSHG